jgi:transcriptional regulator GlxA family with amidase domain
MDMPPRNCRSYRVGVLLIDGFALLSYASVVEPLRAANMLGGRELYRITNIPASGDVATSSGGAVIPADGRVGADTEFDLVLITAGGDPATYNNKRVFDWLRRLARRGITLGGVSGGPVILASAGLMKGRRMTVHWEHAAALTEISPSLPIERSLYVIDRDRVTCAGGTAPMDLMHALIAEHHGPDLARRVSDWFMHTEIRPSGGPQRAGRVARYHTTDATILRAIEAMENHVADPLELRQLASIAGVSLRQLNRQFRTKIGQSTMRFYRYLRLEKARNLLTNSSLRITEIALATGFANSAHFSTAFVERYGSPPSSYR